MIETLSDHLAGAALALGLFSLATVLLFATIGARLLASLPADYFVNDSRRRQHHYLDRFPAPLRPVLHMLRNLLGLLLVLIGLVLLVLPGQGLLTIVAGLVLMDFPGKFACERWVVKRRQVREAINWLRRRNGAPPLVLETAPESSIGTDAGDG